MTTQQQRKLGNQASGTLVKLCISNTANRIVATVRVLRDMLAHRQLNLVRGIANQALWHDTLNDRCTFFRRRDGQ